MADRQRRVPPSGRTQWSRPPASRRAGRRTCVGHPISRALWKEHQIRMAERIAALNAGLPKPDIARYDRSALRTIPALFLVVAFGFPIPMVQARLQMPSVAAGSRSAQSRYPSRRTGHATRLYRPRPDFSDRARCDRPRRGVRAAILQTDDPHDRWRWRRGSDLRA